LTVFFSKLHILSNFFDEKGVKRDKPMDCFDKPSVMYILLIILYVLIVSFAVMIYIIHRAPEYIEDENGNLIPKDKY
jgi:hypothetical protein